MCKTPIKHMIIPRVNSRQRCGCYMHSLVPTTDQEIAERFWQRMNWNVQRDGWRVLRLFALPKADWIENLVWAVAPGLLGQFSFELRRDSTEVRDVEANGDWGISRVLPESSQPANPDLDIEVGKSRTFISDGSHDIYICLYKRKGNFWRLRHAKLLRQPGANFSAQVEESPHRTSGTTTIESGIELQSESADTSRGTNMNRVLFNALRAKILGIHPPNTSPWKLNSFVQLWRSWVWPWKWNFKIMLRKSCNSLWRRFDPVAVSGLEFWEVRKLPPPVSKYVFFADTQQFKLNPVPKLVDPVKKDKLPHEDDTSPTDAQSSDIIQNISSDWEFSPLVGEELIHFKAIISGDTLLHLLKYPEDANAELPIWSGLPKKIRTKLTNQKRVQMPGWGFQVEHEWNSVAFVVMTCPIIIVGLIIAITLSVKFNWSVSGGITLALLPVTLVMYINTMLGGITKQKGLSN